MIAASAELHQFLRIFHRHQPQQDLVTQSKHRRIRADAEGERDDGDGGEDGGTAEGSQGVAQVLCDVHEYLLPVPA